VEAPWRRAKSVTSLDPASVRSQALASIDAIPFPAGDDDGFYRRLRRLVESKQLDLPPFPAVARELDGLLKDTATEILQIARVVERDPGLVRRVWTQARSALYSSPPRSLHHAISRVGLDTLWRIGMSVCLNDTVLRVQGFEDDAAHLRVVGIATAETAAHLGGEKRGSLYMAGLLHDVGRLLVLRAAGGCAASPPRAVVAEVQDKVGAALAVLVAEGWGFDESVSAAVGFSANPAAAPQKHREAATIVRASTIAAHTVVLAAAHKTVLGGDPAAEIEGLGFRAETALQQAEEVRSSLQRSEAPSE
jgi:HD-like signal output (HDOD) protein